MAIAWKSVREFCQIMITYASEQKFDLKILMENITLKYEVQNFWQ